MTVATIKSGPLLCKCAVGNESHTTYNSISQLECAHLIKRSERSLAVFGHFFIVLWREAFMALGKRPLASNTTGSDVSFSRVGDVSTPNFQALDSSHARKFAHEASSRPFFNHFLMSEYSLSAHVVCCHTQRRLIFRRICVFAQKRVKPVAPDAARATRHRTKSAIAIGHVDFDSRVCERSGSLPALCAFA